MAIDNTNSSAIKMNANLEERINAAQTSAEVTAILHQAAIDQGLVRPDVYDPNILIPTEPGTAPQKFAKRVAVDGKNLIFEGDSELLVEQRITEYFRDLLEKPANAAAEAAAAAARTQQTDQARGADGKFVSQEEADRVHQLEVLNRADLDLKFKRGEISTADYMATSGVLENYVEKTLGVSMDDIQAAAQEKQQARFSASWEQATAEFLNSSAGGSWPGGDENKNALGVILQEHGLVDAEDKVAALKTAYKFMQEHNLLVVPRDVAFKTALESAKSAEEIREITRAYSGTSGLFNR
jgi:hypothetical protein